MLQAAKFCSRFTRCVPGCGQLQVAETGALALAVLATVVRRLLHTLVHIVTSRAAVVRCQYLHIDSSVLPCVDIVEASAASYADCVNVSAVSCDRAQCMCCLAFTVSVQELSSMPIDCICCLLCFLCILHVLSCVFVSIAARLAEELRLSLALVLLRCPFLERNLYGLKASFSSTHYFLLIKYSKVALQVLVATVPQCVRGANDGQKSKGHLLGLCSF